MCQSYNEQYKTKLYMFNANEYYLVQMIIMIEKNSHFFPALIKKINQMLKLNKKHKNLGKWKTKKRINVC